jgi:hypothetical protein
VDTQVIELERDARWRRVRFAWGVGLLAVAVALIMVDRPGAPWWQQILSMAGLALGVGGASNLIVAGPRPRIVLTDDGLRLINPLQHRISLMVPRANVIGVELVGNRTLRLSLAPGARVRERRPFGLWHVTVSDDARRDLRRRAPSISCHSTRQRRTSRSWSGSATAPAVIGPAASC